MTEGKSITQLLLRASCALTLACFILISAAQAQSPERVTSVEGITEYRLPNGLRVLLFPDPTKQTITVNITYLVGSRHENYGETGMAHLLEHLVFKGTPKHPNIPQELTERGSRPNGTTSYDRTNYFETFAATDDNLRWALDLESDRMVNSFIAKKDLDSEFSVVRNEYESGENSPINALIKRLMEASFAWHNYGKDTIGERSDIENVNIERLQAFYKRYYQPDNAVLMIAGKFDEPKTLEMVKQYFGPVPKPARELPRLYTNEPTQDGERTVAVRRVGDIQGVGVAYHIPAGSHPDFAAIQALGVVLADTPSGRLHKAVVETKKAVTAANFQFQTHDPGASLFYAVVPKDASVEATRDAILQTIDDLAKNPPTADEVERARQKLLKNIELASNNSDNIGLTMSEYIAMGDWRLYFLRRDRLKKVTPEDVKRVAAAYLKPSNRTVGLFIPTPTPDRAEIPPRPDVAAMLKDYKGEAPVAMGEEFDPSPANIDSRTSRSTASGLKLALLSKKTRGGKVVARLSLRFGNEKDLLNRADAGSLAGGLLMRGTSKRTREQIQDEIDKLKARVNVFGASTQAGAMIETTRENLPAVMRLVAEILREPSFPEKEFEQLKQNRITGSESQRSEPISVAFNAFSRHMNPYPKGHFGYVRTVDESIADLKAVTLDDVKKFHSDFYGADHGELAVVGDFDDKEIAKLASELFGGWKSSRPFTRIPQTYNNVEPINKSFETPDKANAFFLAGINLNLRDDDPEYPALVLGNYMLGGGFLNSRLAVRIRQKDGLSYGVGSSFGAGELDKSGSFLANAIYAPQNAAKLEAAFKEELARAIKDGFTPDEVEKAKSGWLKSRQVSRAQDNELAGALVNRLYLNRTLAWDAEMEKKVEALTPEQIQAAMRKHIDPARITIIKAGDFAKAAQKQANN
ncbi:MAG TPA: pitrilysin family protein [Blastocatellia bacterium]|nr:pitrilysin family protein [Blastocatellia bacterium]